MKIYPRAMLAIITSLSITSSTIALADPPHRHWHGDHYRYYRDYPHWHDGSWYHGNYRGRVGWWWITAGNWYYYPAPVYPYPAPYPRTVVIEREPAPQREPIWYFCESSGKYYPYTSVCPEGWRAVPVQPEDDYERPDEQPEE
jgi:hypothetical protein